MCGLGFIDLNKQTFFDNYFYANINNNTKNYQSFIYMHEASFWI